MIRQGQKYLEEQLERFTKAKAALLADNENYAKHEEKRQDLLKYYNEKIKSYANQLASIHTKRKDNATITKTIKVKT